MEKTPKYTFFVHMNATKEWLSLSEKQREEFVAGEFAPIFQNYPDVSLRFYDAETFTTRCSDIAVFETESVPQFYNLMDNIRDSKIFTVPYFNFVDIFPSIEADFV